MSTSVITQREVLRWTRCLRYRSLPMITTDGISLSRRRGGDELRVMCGFSPSENARDHLLLESLHPAGGPSGTGA